VDRDKLSEYGKLGVSLIFVQNTGWVMGQYGVPAVTVKKVLIY
jgi:hypothetical protein